MRGFSGEFVEGKGVVGFWTAHPCAVSVRFRKVPLHQVLSYKSSSILMMAQGDLKNGSRRSNFYGKSHGQSKLQIFSGCVTSAATPRFQFIFTDLEDRCYSNKCDLNITREK